ncbi:ras-related protein Rab-34 [Penaeus vannamei]|nr:ras-related protein Rab-34-like [Penaeus chinensis]XP_047500592.1 ras-related protein Rab-34-like [Penaeus chinensis]XP_047500593.1 ras-related protein Rab-34-like [Penaeus chinensis]
MRLTRSAVYTMLQTHAEKDRIVTSLPPPFIRQATPYNQDDFDEAVKNAANANCTLQAGLKISKMIVLGDVATGKTCLVNRFCHQVFDSNYKATIGVDFEVERFDILGIPFNLQIWDTAGQERFKCIAASYYRGAHAVMVVFDVTNVVTLAHTAQWLEEAREANINSCPLVFLVGTKRDLMSEGAYNQIEAQARRVAHGLGAEYWAVSSKTGDNVEALFMRLAALTFNRDVLQEVKGCDTRKSSGTVKIGERLDDTYETAKKSKCASGHCNK